MIDHLELNCGCEWDSGSWDVCLFHRYKRGAMDKDGPIRSDNSVVWPDRTAGPIPLSGLDNGEDAETAGENQDSGSNRGGERSASAAPASPFPVLGLDDDEPKDYGEPSNVWHQIAATMDDPTLNVLDEIRSIFSAASGREEPYEDSTRQARAEREGLKRCQTCDSDNPAYGTSLNPLFGCRDTFHNPPFSTANHCPTCTCNKEG